MAGGTLFGNNNTHMAKGYTIWTPATDGEGGTLPGGSSQMCQSGLTSPARQLDEVGWGKITWSDLWNMDTNRLSFIIRATHAVLPSPTDLHLWYGEDPACHQCAAPATLKHILMGVKNSLTQGRYTWHHKLVLRCLATALEDKRVSISAISLDAQTAFP